MAKDENRFCASEMLPLDTILALKYGEGSERPNELVELLKRTDEWGRYQSYALAMCEKGEMPHTFGIWRKLVGEYRDESVD